MDRFRFDASRRKVLAGIGCGAGVFGPVRPWGPRRRAGAGLPLLPPIAGPLEAGVWSNPWAPATWAKTGGLYPWKASNAILTRGQLVLRVAAGGAASVQANDDQRRRRGLFEIDATLPPARPGLIIAPLYLYGPEGHEIDFEVVGTRGLQLSVHTATGFNAHTRLLPGDWSGRRRFGVRYDAGRSVDWLVDGGVVHSLEAAAVPVFPFHGLKPYAEIWPARDARWAGRWTEAEVRMLLHGYRLT